MYVICGDGDLMEGVVLEIVLFVGYLGFGKLIVLYDFNDICLDGDLSVMFSENVVDCFCVYGW